MLFEKAHQFSDIGIFHGLHGLFIVRAAMQRGYKWSIPFRVKFLIPIRSRARVLEDKAASLTHLIGSRKPVTISVGDGAEYLPAAEIARQTVFVGERGGIESEPRQTGSRGLV
jgi:hypothetical protein